MYRILQDLRIRSPGATLNGGVAPHLLNR